MDLFKTSVGIGLSYCVTRFFFPYEVKLLTNFILYKSFVVYSGCKFYAKKISNKIANNIDKKKLYFIKNEIKLL